MNQTVWRNRIPTYDELMLPLLQMVSDGDIYQLSQITGALADYVNLTSEQRDELLPSGKRTRFADRVSWAKTHLQKALLIESAGWGKFRITTRGIWLLAQKPVRITHKVLMQFPEYAQFATRKPELPMLPVMPVDDEYDLPIMAHLTPQDLIEMAYQNLMNDLADELLEMILSAPPRFFERLVLELLMAMGYGDPSTPAKAVGGVGDGGIDGYIYQDKLGLEVVYIQAKRWSPEKPVGRPDIQAFVGSLLGVGGKKGVFITTSRFSQSAMNYADELQHLKLVLIDGARLTQLMIEHNVGVIIEK
ncbi:MAG: restriction endonuclease, partial [Anaerolineae bacterium]|nr:restriction endonuclease [Anaerolineae bacterium]